MTILHLAEWYQDQYRERGLCLSEAQNEASFRDFVAQYYSSLHWKLEVNPIIDPEVPLFWCESECVVELFKLYQKLTFT